MYVMDRDFAYYLFRDAGLKDICIEAGIVAEGSINGILDGKYYNRAVRVHRCIYEALLRLAWEAVMLWVNDNIQDMNVVIKTFLDQVNRITDDLNQQRFSDLLQRPLLAELTPLWKDFLEHLRHNSGELAAFWMAYIDMVEDILIGILHASCEGNWNLHLHAVRNMIPWCFAYDKLKYARYMSPYYAQMTNLPEKNPRVNEAFLGIL